MSHAESAISSDEGEFSSPEWDQFVAAHPAGRREQPGRYAELPVGRIGYAPHGLLTVRDLESRRRAFLKRGATLPNFVVVDSDRPFDRVYEDVARHITSLVTGLDDPNRGTHIP